MPRTRSLAWSELKIGVLTIAAIAIAALLIFSLTGTKGFPWQRYSLKTRLGNVAGLAPGSPVRIAGVEVGSVTAVDFAGEAVEVAAGVFAAASGMIGDFWSACPTKCLRIVLTTAKKPLRQRYSMKESGFG